MASGSLTKPVVGVTLSNTLDIHTLTQAEQDRIKRRQELVDLHGKGYSVATMADKLDVTTQRIYQMLQALGLPSPTDRDKEAS